MTIRRAHVTIAGAFWIAGALFYMLAEAVTAAAFPGYSYSTNYISDLGIPEAGAFQGRAIDSPLHALMNAAFVAQGALYLAAAIVAASRATSRTGKIFLGLAAIYAVGIFLVGTIHGSQASVENGSAILHVVGAAMAIIGGNLATITAGIAARRLSAPTFYTPVSIALGTLGLIGLVMLQIDSGSTTFSLLPDGVWERIAVYTVTAWQLLTGILLLTRRGTRN